MRPAAEPSVTAGRVALALAALGVLLAAADTYVVVLALPEIMLDVGLDAEQLQRAAPIVSAFLLGYVTALPLAGRLSDLHGRRPVLLACLVMLAVGSLVTAAAPDLVAVVIGRFLQGAGGGGLVPSSRPLDLLVLVVGLIGLVALGLALAAPATLREDVTAGALYVPVVGDTPYATPLALVALGAAVLLVVRGLTAHHPLVDLRRVRVSAHAVDLLGAALLAVALGSVVLTFASADPQVEVLSPAGPWLLALGAGGLVGFVLRQRRTEHPLVPVETVRATAAWGALAVSVLVGAALVVALVDIPVFARAVLTGESQLDAALILLRLLVALPLGAVAGGWALRRVGYAVPAGLGLAMATVALALMSRWDAHALASTGSTLTLVAAGLGFGLAVAPVNAALLAVTPAAVHGIASAMVVVARTVGMIVGLSALSAYGVRRFHAEVALLPAPTQLCTDSPATCPAYVSAVRDAALVQLQTTFGAAATCLAVASVLAVAVLRPGVTGAPGPARSASLSPRRAALGRPPPGPPPPG